MFVVIFEVYPTTEGMAEYLEIAAELRGFLENRDGFISIERFQSLSEEGKILSLSFWRDEAAVQREALDGIARALDNLPRRLRCALELAMDRDGTHRERAQALGCATKTVSTRVFRARRQFARILERAG